MTAADNSALPAKRHGKRKVADPRGQWVHVRCNASEHAAIRAAAAQAGLGTGAYLRSLAIGTAGPRARRQPRAGQAELARVLGLLGNYGSNLNQIARIANTSGDFPAEAQLVALADQVREVRDAVMLALGREP